MPRNVTKKRKLTKAEKRRIERQQFYTKVGLGTAVVLLVGGLVLMPLMNSKGSSADYSAEDFWYIPEGSVEIAAAERDEPQFEPAQTPVPAATSAPGPVQVEVRVVEAEGGDELSSKPFAAAVITPEPTPVATLPAQDVLVDTRATPKPYEYVTITAVGDCTLGGETKSGGKGEARFAEYVANNGYDYFLQNVRELFESDDLTIVNLEGPLTTADDRREDRQFNFRGDPEYVNILSGSSVEVCNLANNHAYDFGEAGFEQTQQTLKDAGIGACGFGLENYSYVGGYTIGSLGFTEWDYTTDEIVNAVSAAREKCDLLLVSIHWGAEMRYTPTSECVELGHKIVDAGADLVIGNHSHVYGAIEEYNDKYIIYSLGNFCFGGNGDPEDTDCAIFQQTFRLSGSGVMDAGINIIPASVTTADGYNNFQPVILEGEKGMKLLSKIAKISNLTEDSVVWMENSYYLQQKQQAEAQTEEPQSEATANPAH